MDQATIDDFLRLDIRSGTIISAAPFPEARKPAWKLKIDFGAEIGVKNSSAQITDLYTCDDLRGAKIMAVVNFPPRQIGPIMSEVLVLGVPDAEGRIVLAAPKSDVPDGSKLA